MHFSNRESVYVQIAQDIFRLILMNELKQGDVLRSVRALAKEYQVTPKTIQNATNYLVELGVLIKRQGVGMTITDDIKVIEDVKWLYIKELKQELEQNLFKVGISLEEFLGEEG